MDRINKILGGLLGGALGDAMGAATETRSISQIINYFGEEVKDLKDIPDDVFARDFKKGSVTDDFSLAYETAKAIVDNKGIVDDEVSKRALINWSKTPYYVLAGPTTIKALDKLLGKEVQESFIKYDSSKGSDGGAMKIAPVGLISGGNIDKAIKDAITICKPTHFNSTALAGALAISASVSEALNDNCTIDSIIKAGLKGALFGEQYAKSMDKELANPSVYKRIILAVEIANKYKGNIKETMQELADIIGSGLSASEAVPCVYGILKACNGDTYQSIVSAVNIGGDTDTVATMVGSIAGTYQGYYDERYLRIINEVNNYDLLSLAKRIDEVINV